MLLQAVGRQTSHAGRTTVTITSSHGEHARARAALTRIAGFFTQLRKTAEQLTALERISARTKTRPAAIIARGGCQLQLRLAITRRRQPPNSRI